MLIVTAVLMQKGKWWGCAIGIIVGIALIGMGMQETEQIFKEWPIGVLFIIYYIVCGFISYKRAK